mgnify:CR=1 FL=1
MVSLPFFMQNVLHYNAVEIGLLLTPWPLTTILTAPIAGRLVERVHPGLLGGMGMAVFAAGLFSLYILPEHPESWNIIWRMALCGMGFGLFQTPNNVTIVSSAPTRRSGGASGMLGNGTVIGTDIRHHPGGIALSNVSRRRPRTSLFVSCHIICHWSGSSEQHPNDTGFTGRKKVLTDTEESDGILS